MRVVHGRLTRRAAISLSSLAAVVLAAAAHAGPVPAPVIVNDIAKGTGAPCAPSADVNAPAACVILARGGGGGGAGAGAGAGGGHSSGHSGHRGGHMNAKSSNSTGNKHVGSGALGRQTVDNRIMATDGNVTTGPNVATSPDINDRRGAAVTNGGRVVVLNDRRDINDRRAAVVTNDGRVVVLSDGHAAVVNGMSGVLIRFHGD